MMRWTHARSSRRAEDTVPDALEKESTSLRRRSGSGVGLSVPESGSDCPMRRHHNACSPPSAGTGTAAPPWACCSRCRRRRRRSSTPPCHRSDPAAPGAYASLRCVNYRVHRWLHKLYQICNEIIAVEMTGILINGSDFDQTITKSRFTVGLYGVRTPYRCCMGFGLHACNIRP